MPLFGPFQYSRQTSDSLGILHVKTPCFIFNQPQTSSNSAEKNYSPESSYIYKKIFTSGCSAGRRLVIITFVHH
jgi:hypothetical protein